MGDALTCLTTDWILSQFGRDRSKAQKVYRKFARQGRGMEIWDELRHGCLLGTDAFEAKIAPSLSQSQLEIEIPRSQLLAAGPSLDELFSDAADKPSRNRKIREVMRSHEYTLKELSAHLGLHYSTVSVIAKNVDEVQEHQK